MTNSIDPLDRLRAGLDRDEALARAALGQDHVHEDGGKLSCPGERCAHDVQHDPARVLRQVQRLRTIADFCENMAAEDVGYREIAVLLADIYVEDDETGDPS